MNNENNNNNNQNNNYVTPEKIDLSKVQIDKSNENALNRERDNIISASIQANEAIDETKAKNVNNTIKIKKKNPVVSLLIGLIFIGIAIFLAYVGFRLLQNYIKYDDAKHTTTTTTTQKVNYFANYIYNENKLRKFQNDSIILILFPNLLTSGSRYIYVQKGENGLLLEEEGTYTISDRLLVLSSEAYTQKTFNIDESSLINADIVLNMADQEYKYYLNKTDASESVLLVNATLNANFAYTYDLNSHGFLEYTETMSDISLSNGAVYAKSGQNLIYNGFTFTYME